MTTAADGFLYLLKMEPTLLPAAPSTGNLALAIEHRRLDAVHACLRCGKQAQCAYIAHTEIGNRWLDLCAACSSWLITNATPADMYE